MLQREDKRKCPNVPTKTKLIASSVNNACYTSRPGMIARAGETRRKLHVDVSRFLALVPLIYHERISFGARELGGGDFQPLFTRRGQLPQRFPRRLPRLVSQRIYTCAFVQFFFCSIGLCPAILPAIARVTYICIPGKYVRRGA